MHILLAILGGLGTLALILYRLGMFSRGAGDLVDTAERAHGAWRRHKFRNRAEKPALETESDPRAAAAAVAVSIVQCAGPIGAEEEDALRGEFETVLQVEDSAGSPVLRPLVDQGPPSIPTRFRPDWRNSSTPSSAIPRNTN